MDPDSYTAKYNIQKPVYFESTSDVKAAIEREKQIKGWNRKRKNKLAESKNPPWAELYDSILPQGKRIATPVCALARNDSVFITLLHCFFHFEYGGK